MTYAVEDASLINLRIGPSIFEDLLHLQPEDALCWLTSWRAIRLQKLIVSQLVRNFPVFY